MTPIAQMRHPDPAVRRSIRVVAMVSELHKAGYQRLRVMPYLSPSGAHWRLAIAPADQFDRRHGALLANAARDAVDPAGYSSGQAADGTYFGWTDAADDDARALAAKFLDRFPRLAEAGRGWDYAYAGWFQHLLGLVEQALFPVVMSDYEEPSSSHIRLSNMRPESWARMDLADMPLPPPTRRPKA